MKSATLKSGSNVRFILGEEAVTTGISGFKFPWSVFAPQKNVSALKINHPPRFRRRTIFQPQTPLIRERRRRWKSHPLRQRTHTHAHTTRWNLLGLPSTGGHSCQQEGYKPDRAGLWCVHTQQQQLPPPLTPLVEIFGLQHHKFTFVNSVFTSTTSTSTEAVTVAGQ